MNNKGKIKLLIMAFAVSLLFGTSVLADVLSDKLSGRILLQVEDKGQAWYVEPDSGQRVFLGRPQDAFRVMQEFGLGINEAYYSKIINGTPQKLAGRILLRVEAKGEAYFVNPLDLQIRYLGRPSDAFVLMRELGLGISNQNLEKIAVKPNYEENDYNLSVVNDIKNKDNEQLSNQAQEEEAVIIENINISDISDISAKVTWEINKDFQSSISYGLESGKYGEEFSINGIEIEKGVYGFSKVLENLEPGNNYYFIIKAADNQGNEILTKEYNFFTNKKLRDFSLGEIKLINKTTVKASYPSVVGKDGNYGLLWWDGFASFSRFNPTNLSLDRIHSFNGANPGDLSWNKFGYAIAWEKNCQVYVDVVNELNNTLNESKRMTSRLDEGCPINIRLASDDNNFALLWTGKNINEKASMYLKMFTPKAISINSEIIISDAVDSSVRPLIIWNGEAYLVVWQENQDQEKDLYIASFDQDGKVVRAKQKIFKGVNVISNLELLAVGNDYYKLFWLENTQEEAVIKILSFDINQAELAELSTINIKMLVNNNSSLSVARNNEFYGISWSGDDKHLYFAEIDSKNTINSKIEFVSQDLIEALQGEIFVFDDKYGLFWHGNDANSKALYFRFIY